jgi:hypothetical protein
LLKAAVADAGGELPKKRTRRARAGR